MDAWSLRLAFQGLASFVLVPIENGTSANTSR